MVPRRLIYKKFKLFPPWSVFGASFDGFRGNPPFSFRVVIYYCHYWCVRWQFFFVEDLPDPGSDTHRGRFDTRQYAEHAIWTHPSSEYDE